MANQINHLVGMGAELYADRIVVTDGEAFRTAPMRLADVDAIAGLDGVAAAEPKIEFLWESNPEGQLGRTLHERLVLRLRPGRAAKRRVRR